MHFNYSVFFVVHKNKRFYYLYRAMQSTCHSNVNTVHDCLSIKGLEIATQNYIQEIDATVVHTARRPFHEGDFSLFLNFFFSPYIILPLCPPCSLLGYFSVSC